MRVMNAQSVKCVVCAGSSSEWVRCRRLPFCDAVDGGGNGVCRT